MTAPKDGCKRRVIVDLSLPSVHQHAVNMSVSNSNYLGTPFSLKLPTIDTLSQALTIVGNNVKIFKVDLARAFRQLNLDLFDVKYMGFYWRGQFYVNTAVPFGYRHSTLCMQRVTDLIRHIIFTHYGVLLFNYIDYIIGIAPDDVADSHFKITLNLLNSLGFILSNSKTLSPSKIPTCLGIQINLNNGTLHIPLAKLQDVIALCQKYINQKTITKKRVAGTHWLSYFYSQSRETCTYLH
jgi:hypothetical protein